MPAAIAGDVALMEYELATVTFVAGNTTLSEYSDVETKSTLDEGVKPVPVIVIEASLQELIAGVIDCTTGGVTPNAHELRIICEPHVQFEVGVCVAPGEHDKLLLEVR